MHWMLNAYWEPLTFELPCRCARRIDALPTPEDVTWKSARRWQRPLRGAARSVVVLVRRASRRRSDDISEVAVARQRHRRDRHGVSASLVTADLLRYVHANRL